MIIDITRPIYQGMPVYPGNQETIFEQIGQWPKDRSVSTQIMIGSHAGTHVDAPNHVIEGAGGIDSYPLERFIGEAVVLDLTCAESVITKSVIANAAGDLSTESGGMYHEPRIGEGQPMIHSSKPARPAGRFMIQLANRIVLLKTKNSAMDWSVFHEDFVALNESAAQYLVSLRPKLIGIDGPSIKKFRVPDQTHQIILSQDIPIIEWLDLAKVEEGIYQFIGFPLAFNSLDGSLLRAVLLTETLT